MVLRALVLSCKCCFCIHFTTSPLKCITCNKAMVINSVLLSPWVLHVHVVLNYKCKCLNKCVVYFFMALFVIFLNFLQWNLPKVFTAHCTSTSSVPNFTESRQRKCEKMHPQFPFLCSCWCHKILKSTDGFLWASQITWPFILSVCVCDGKITESTKFLLRITLIQLWNATENCHGNVRFWVNVCGVN